MSEVPWPQIGLIIGALIGAAGVIYTARSSRRSADRTTDTQRIDKMWDRIDKMQVEIDDLRDERIEQDRLLRTHEAWDVEQIAKLKAAGIPTTEPPPLTVRSDP